MGKIVTIMNQKGGVGKTTTAINLSACLGVAERKVLLIDLDPQGNATSGLGINKNSFDGASIYEALLGARDIKECIYPTELHFLKICPANTNLVGAEIELVTIPEREKRLRLALEPIMNDYDYILIDCPPSLGLLTLNALTAANSYLVPMQTEYFAMEGLSQLMSTVKLVQQSLNPQLQLEGILLTMFDARNNLCHQVSEDMRGHFKNRVFKTNIPRNVKLSESPSHGKPVIFYDINSKGSHAYLSLAKEIILNNEKSATEVSTQGEVK